MNVEQRQVAGDPQTKSTNLGRMSASRLLRPPLTFSITPLESWYSFYRPTEAVGEMFVVVVGAAGSV